MASCHLDDLTPGELIDPSYLEWYANSPPERRVFLDREEPNVPVYDRDGNQMPYARWVWAMETQPGYSLIGHDHVADGLVSTIWLGLDHSFGNTSPPIIYETMLFDIDDWVDHQDRYTSLDDAQKNHRYIVEMLKATR
jgi:hypothetical protein